VKFSFKNPLYMVPAAIIFLVIAAIPWFGSEYMAALMVTILLYSILTVAWAMFSAPTGYMSLGTAAFFGVGAYTTAILGKELPFPVVVISGGLISFILALGVGAACLRLRGVYFAIFSFGLSELILNAVLFYEAERSGTMGRIVVSMDHTLVYYLMFAIFIILLLVVYFLWRSKYGLALKSIGQSEEAAAHTGVNVNAVKIITFATTALFMGLTGAILVTQWTYVDSRIAFNMNYSFMPVLMAIFGGIQLVSGQILGAVILTLISESLLIRFPYHYMLVFGLLIIAFILFFPSGVVGLVTSIWKKLRQGWRAQHESVRGS
jgi:branched-chain amino acid transport system permease protein